MHQRGQLLEHSLLIGARCDAEIEQLSDDHTHSDAEAECVVRV